MDKQKMRFEAAKAAMQGLLANPGVFGPMGLTNSSEEFFITMCVEFGDRLVAEVGIKAAAEEEARRQEAMARQQREGMSRKWVDHNPWGQ